VIRMEGDCRFVENLMGRLDWLEDFVEGHNFIWLAFLTNHSPNFIGRRPDPTRAGFQVEDWPRFKADASGWYHPAYGCQGFCLKKSWVAEWCDRMLELRRPYGLDMFFHSLDHCSDAECKFPSRSLGGQQPGQSDSFGHFAWGCGLIEPTPDLDSITLRHFGLSEYKGRRYKLWANHLKRLSAGPNYENQPSYRLWTLHGADLDQHMDTINLSHVERAEQIRRRSRSASRRRNALNLERPPQTAAGRIAEGARSATEFAARGQAHTAGASSSGAAASGCRLTPWHEVPGGSIGVLLQDREELRAAEPEREIPPMPRRPAPSAQAPNAPGRMEALVHAAALAKRRATGPSRP
jgi:hypothetical protein